MNMKNMKYVITAIVVVGAICFVGQRMLHKQNDVVQQNSVANNENVDDVVIQNSSGVVGSICGHGSNCMSGTCIAETCMSCGEKGMNCSNDGACCVPMECLDGKCFSCFPLRFACTESEECCSCSCIEGKCSLDKEEADPTFLKKGISCSESSQCQSDYCVNGACS